MPEEHGYLGKNILGSSFDFDLEIVRGGGAFVCGESSALMGPLKEMLVSLEPNI